MRRSRRLHTNKQEMRTRFTTLLIYLLLCIIAAAILYSYLQTPRTSKRTEQVKAHSQQTKNPEELHDLKDDGVPTKRKVGQYTWGFLHMMIGNLPDYPSAEDKKNILDLVNIVCNVFPCKVCRNDFREILAQEAKLCEKECKLYGQNRTQLATWMCRVHNHVNVKLGKPKFDCSIETLDKRWKITEELE